MGQDHLNQDNPTEIWMVGQSAAMSACLCLKVVVQYEMMNKLFMKQTCQVVMKKSGLPFSILQEKSKVNVYYMSWYEFENVFNLHLWMCLVYIQL